MLGQLGLHAETASPKTKTRKTKGKLLQVSPPTPHDCIGYTSPWRVPDLVYAAEVGFNSRGVMFHTICASNTETVASQPQILAISLMFYLSIFI